MFVKITPLKLNTVDRTLEKSPYAMYLNTDQIISINESGFGGFQIEVRGNPHPIRIDHTAAMQIVSLHNNKN